jgi:hydroxymethylglutaryl-CoA reductase (NADPH)
MTDKNEISRSAFSHLKTYDQTNLKQRLAPKFGNRLPRVPFRTKISAEGVIARWQLLSNSEQSRKILLDAQTIDHMSYFQANIENFIGTVKVPVGLAGPLRVNGLYAQDDYYIPLATTEAALVASYSRGAQLISEAGGCSAMLLDEGVGRSPCFVFRTLEECGLFAAWIHSQWETLQYEANKTTNYGKLINMKSTIEGNHLYIHFSFETGDAAGQNMVTIATEAVCAYISQYCPFKPECFFVDANFSGDKKASAQSLQTVRGKKVSAEVYIPTKLVQKWLHTTPEHIANFGRIGSMAAVLSGTVGAQGHFANGLAALYIACGQDTACVAESAIGVTRLEVVPEGDLYASVLLPNLIVGTIGGGTNLPSQHACLDILKLSGAGNSRAFAEVCAGLCLAGEISLVAAICAGRFARAHKSLAREREVSPKEV